MQLWECSFTELSLRQEGLVAIFQLPDIGCTADHWWRARRSGRWEPVSPRVLRLSGSPPTEAQRVMAGVLDASPGAVLHEASALAWMDFDGFNLAKIVVVRQ